MVIAFVAARQHWYRKLYLHGTFTVFNLPHGN